ncbi:MAG: PAS domain S-box protein [Syntrophus sp. (in: bacteria)]
MHDPSKTNQELIEENSLLKQRIQELEKSEVERKQIEKVLRESEAQKNAILNGIKTNIAFVDKDLRILWLNVTAAESVNKSPEEMTGHACHEFWADPSKPCKDCPTLRAFQTKKPEHAVLHTPDGRIWDERGEPVFDMEGNLIGVVEIAQDITEHRRAGEALHLFKDLVEHSSDAIGMSTPEGRHYYQNEAFDRLFGNIGDFPPETVYIDKAIGKQVFDTIMDGGRWQGEVKMFKKDRTILDIFQRAYAIKNQDGRIIGLVGLNTDITKRKLAEESLREQKEKFRLITETIDEVFWMADVDIGRMFYISPSYERVWGRSREGLYENPQSFLDAVHVEDRECVIAGLTIEKSGQPFEHEYRIVLPDGNVRHIWDRGFPIHDEKGQVHSYAGIAIDITEQKQSEASMKLRLQLLEFSVTHGIEELLQKSLDEIGALTGSPIGFYHFVEADEKTLSLQAWSTRTEREFCLAAGKGLHYGIEQAGVWVDSIRERKPVIHNDYAALPHRKGLPPGHAAVIRELTMPIFRGGKIVAILGIGNKPVDYTEADLRTVSFLADVTWEIARKKMAEKELSESEVKFRLIFDTTLEGIYQSTPEGCYIVVNPAFAHMLGYESPKDLMETVNNIGQQLYADPNRQSEIKRLLATEGTAEGFEAQLYRKDCSTIWVIINAMTVKNEKGDILCYQGGMIDITDRKQAEDRLRASEAKYSNYTANAPDGVFVANEKGRYLEVNRAACLMTGYREEELLQMSISDLLSGESLESGLANFRKLIETGKSKGEGQFNHKDGSKRWWFMDAVKLSQTRYLGFAKDITERKDVDVQLRKSTQLLQNVIDHSQYFIYAKDLDGRFIMASKSLALFFGQQTHEDLLGKTSHDFLPKSTADKHRANDLDVMAQQTHIQFEETVEIGDGLLTFISTKFPLLDVEGKLYAVCGASVDITERKAMEEALRKSEEKYRGIFDESIAAIYIFDNKKNFIDANQAGLELLGYSREELLNMGITDVDADPVIVLPAHQELLSGGRLINYEHKLRRKDGTVVTVLNNSIPLTDTRGNVIGMLSTLLNITDRKRMEEEKADLEAQIQQVQKMESVGRLAGGVAHDFNNKLGVILGYTEMALDQVDPTLPLHADLEQIRTAADHAADLTRQLLAFARKQTVAPKVLDLNKTVTSMLKMLQRLIGENIHINWQPDANLWPVKVDPSQIDQILTNLCINARDAISDVGKMTIETGKCSFDEDYCAAYTGFLPGEYVLLAVSDNGCGMDKETLSHLFEPFYTTKVVSKGTGLGLATVYGIVSQNNGIIKVYSEPDKGTTFRIYLPRHEGKTKQVQTRGPVEACSRGRETILLVEDDPSILEMTTRMLEKHGYTVLSANVPGAAIRLALERSGEIHLLMTDVVMPEMNGRDLAKNLLSLYPHLKRLFMSGYTADVIAHHGVLDEGVYFIRKPFSIKELAAKVREVLDQE